MSKFINDVDFTVDEHIWGHRLYNEQLPHLIILEFLNILQSNMEAPLKHSADETVKYQPQHQIRLRTLLFSNPFVEIIRSQNISDEEKWKTWTKEFKNSVVTVSDDHIEHIRNSFASFEDFARAVELLRSSAFEGQSNKRWSSKFVFPFGPDAFYEDLRFKDENASNDRRFFARTGEILYLMLSRAKNGPILGQRLVDRLLKHQSSLNKLVQVLQGQPQIAINKKDVGYLPYKQLDRFDRLCDDWLGILDRDMPIYDALDHLITITGLNLILYFLERGKQSCGDLEPVELISEIVSLQRTRIRKLSMDSYRANDSYSVRAVKSYIERVKTTDEWESALKSDSPNEACARVMEQCFQWPEEGEEDVDSHTHYDELIRKLIEKASSRHEQHVGKIHNNWSRAIGLSSRRLSRRIRYAPNDRLLKTIVITVVEKRMEFSEFLAEIHRRYGFVIGSVEGSHLIKSNQVDQEALMDNAANLEARLFSLGLVRRLSDSCAFVENPFAKEGK